MIDTKVCNDCWHISLRFGERVFQDGLDPYSFIRYLAEKGDIENMRTVCDRYTRRRSYESGDMLSWF